jgi:hypothetical protein
MPFDPAMEAQNSGHPATAGPEGHPYGPASLMYPTARSLQAEPTSLPKDDPAVAQSVLQEVFEVSQDATCAAIYKQVAGHQDGTARWRCI